METPSSYRQYSYFQTPINFFSSGQSSKEKKKHLLSVSQMSEDKSNEYLEKVICNAYLKNNTNGGGYEITPTSFMKKSSSSNQGNSNKANKNEAHSKNERMNKVTKISNSSIAAVRKNLFTTLKNQIGKGKFPKIRSAVPNVSDLASKKLNPRLFKVKARKKKKVKRGKIRKTKEQLICLNAFYDELVAKNLRLKRSQLRLFSIRINLDESKVYKWLWDKKKKSEKKKLFVVVKTK